VPYCSPMAPVVELREHRPGDEDAIVAWAASPAVTRYLTFGPMDVGQVDSWLADVIAQADEVPRRDWTFAATADGQLAGCVVVSTDSAEHRRAEVGFAIAPEHWRRGIASRAVGLAVTKALGELGLHRLWAVCDPNNIGSQRVLESAGFVREGRLRDDLRLDGVWRDSLVYGVLRDDL